MGRAESQLEAPFSEQIVRAFCSLVDRSSLRSFAVLASYCLWNFRALFSFLLELPLFQVHMSLTGPEYRGAEIVSHVE